MKVYMPWVNWIVSGENVSLTSIILGDVWNALARYGQFPQAVTLTLNGDNIMLVKENQSAKTRC